MRQYSSVWVLLHTATVIPFFALIAGIFRQRENVNLIMAEQKSQSVVLKSTVCKGRNCNGKESKYDNCYDHSGATTNTFLTH